MIHIILRASITTDGFIATKDRNSEWVLDIDYENWLEEIKKASCVIVGRLTFEQYKEEVFPVKGVTNIVITNSKPEESEYDNVFYAIGPRECMELAKEKGFNKAVVAGGAITNFSFLKHNFVDELVLSVHPLVLGDGLSIFNSQIHEKALELLDTKTIGNKLVLLRYKVIK